MQRANKFELWCDAHTWRGHEVGHEFRSDLPESVRVLWHVAQQVDSQPRKTRLLHASRTVPAKDRFDVDKKAENEKKLKKQENYQALLWWIF